MVFRIVFLIVIKFLGIESKRRCAEEMQFRNPN